MLGLWGSEYGVMFKEDLSVFEDHKIRRIYDEEKEIWYFSVIDIIQILTEQEDYQKARKYWNKLKERLKAHIPHPTGAKS